MTSLRTSLFFCPVVFAALSPASAQLLPHDPQPLVVLVSIDGLRPDALEVLGEDGAPTLHRLIGEGAWTPEARTDPTHTITLPNHTSMLTGLPVSGDDGHHWVNNSDPPLGMTPSIFDVVHDHGLRTALFATKSKFSLYDVSYNERNGAPDETGDDNGTDKIDTALIIGDENPEALVRQMLNALKNDDPYQFVLLHFRNPDTSGHARGWRTEEGSHYLNAIAETDGYLARLLETVDNHLVYRDNTFLIVTSDHGGVLNNTGHFDPDASDNFVIPFIVHGPGVEPGSDLYTLNPDTRARPDEDTNPRLRESPPPVRNGDAGNLALDLLGLPPVPGSLFNADQDLAVDGPVVPPSTP